MKLISSPNRSFKYIILNVINIIKLYIYIIEYIVLIRKILEILTRKNCL